MNRLLTGAAAAVCALSIAACTPDQEQQVLTGLGATCAGLQVGTTIAVEVASAVAGGLPAATIAGTVSAVGGSVCNTIVPAVKTIVDNVIASGSTATVTATTTNPVSGQKSVRRMTVTPAGRVVFSGVVTPGQF